MFIWIVYNNFLLSYFLFLALPKIIFDTVWGQKNTQQQISIFKPITMPVLAKKMDTPLRKNSSENTIP